MLNCSGKSKITREFVWTWMDRRTNQTIRRTGIEDHPCEAMIEERWQWKKNWHIVLNKEDKVRWGNARIFMKRSTRIVNCTKNTLQVPVNNISIHPAQQRRQNSQQQFEGLEEYDYLVHWIEKSSFNKFVFIRDTTTIVGIIGDLQPGLNSRFFRRNILTAQGNLLLKWLRQPFFLVQIVVSQVPETFNSLAIDGGGVRTDTPLTQRI